MSWRTSLDKGDLKSYYEAGWRAQKHGTTLHTNPFLKESNYSYAWARGWLDSYEEIDPQTHVYLGMDFGKGDENASIEVVSKDGKVYVSRVSAPKPDLPIFNVPRHSVFAVGVKFLERSNGYSSPGSRAYTYKCNIADIQIGDTAIVFVAGHPKLVRVYEISNEIPHIASKWIAQKVDRTEHDKTIKREARISILKSRLQGRLAEFRRKKSFNELLNNDPEAKTMYAELSALDPDADLSDGWGGTINE